MLQDGGGLKQRVLGSDASVGPDLEDELVVVGALADAGVLHRVFHPRDRREDGIDGDHADGLVGVLVLVAGGKSRGQLSLRARPRISSFYRACR